MTNMIHTFYALAFILLSGLGITFLNPESLLALCFFIFFALLVQNSDAVSQNLEQMRGSVQAELISCMIDGGKQRLALETLNLSKKHQLLIAMNHIV